MLLVVVCILAGVICSEGGYQQSNLPFGIPFPLPYSRGFSHDQYFRRPISYAVQEVPKQDVSYTLSYEDYLYLKRHKLEGQDSPFYPDPTEPPPIKADNKHGRIKKREELKPKTDIPCPDSVLKRSVVTNSINGDNNIFVGDPVVPKVHKHVYFHVPPPDFEEPAPAIQRRIEPTNKRVNILFIKVPSYEPNRAYLQQLLQNQAPIQDKTLIYVLSKKEELPQPVVLPPVQKPEPPEVYFVKYKTSNDIVPNDEFSVSGLLENVPGLEKRSVTRDQ